MMVWRVKPKEGGPWLVADRMFDLGQQLDDMVESESAFVLERVEMSAEELSKVGEFDGW
jgi:hypothetical protein